MISAILGVLFAGLAIGAIVLACIMKDKKRIGAIVVAIFMAVLFVVVPFSIHTIDAGEIAVVKHLGRAKGVRTAGTHFDFWLTEEYQVFDAKVQNLDITTAAYSSDAQTMDIALTIQYQIMSDKVVEITNQYGTLDILQNRIQSIAIEKTKAILSSHKAMDIIADRASMSPAVEDNIREAIGADYYVNIVSVVLTNIDFSDTFESAVEEKMVAEQQQLKAEYENKTKIAQAQAEAEAKLIAAQADAEANELLEKSLTDKILQKHYIEKWDGKLPNVVAGEDSMNLLVDSETAKTTQ
ncbi:MAG: prohibitin family protein [Clostridia bacterium]|nr:prohibitin family protein [Clostridia bacterium]